MIFECHRCLKSFKIVTRCRPYYPICEECFEEIVKTRKFSEEKMMEFLENSKILSNGNGFDE